MQATESLSATLFDSMQNSLVAVAEISGNKLLAYDEVALKGCGTMQGHCIAIDITDLNFQLYCHPGEWGIRLSRTQPPRDVDARISGRLMALINLASQDDKISTSIQERVNFQGNVALAQKLQRIIADLDIDWEEALAKHSGDIFAFQLHQRARRFGDWLSQSADSLLQTSSEYVREEIRISPTVAEFEEFQARLTQLKNDLARSEARLQRLFENIDSR